MNNIRFHKILWSQSDYKIRLAVLLKTRKPPHYKLDYPWQTSLSLLNKWQKLIQWIFTELFNAHFLLII